MFSASALLPFAEIFGELRQIDRGFRQMTGTFTNGVRVEVLLRQGIQLFQRSGHHIDGVGLAAHFLRQLLRLLAGLLGGFDQALQIAGRQAI
jgi:hypothetical protein